MSTVSRLREYIDAAVKAATHVELREHCIDFAELDWIEDTLIELLERHRDECKPELDTKAHAADETEG